MDLTRVGKLLFGNPTRLRLAVWALEHDKRFFQSEPPRDVGVTNAVRDALRQLTQLDMLVEDRPDGENRVYYSVTASPLWSIIRATRDVTSPF